MGVIIVLFAAFFAVVYLGSLLRKDSEASRAATIEDLDEIRSEMASLRQRLENLEAIEASSKLNLDVDFGKSEDQQESAGYGTASKST